MTWPRVFDRCWPASRETDVMNIAFYAPMKPLDSPVPSGDRQLGRLIRQALTGAGHDVIIASTERSWSRHGGAEQEDIRQRCERAALDLVDRWRGSGALPDVWITYHLYHKAPDWIGPIVCNALSLPYIVIEASRAKKRMQGAWAQGFAAADLALARADAVVAMHAEDAVGLSEIVPEDRLHRLAPFIDTRLFQSGKDKPRLDSSTGIKLVTVAMMRRGDKERSFHVLSEALAGLMNYDWTLTIAGDGDARNDLTELFPPERTTWLGQVAPEDLGAIYADGDLFVWPAVNEAFGLVFLEAQAAGLPVVAGRTGGVPDVVAEGNTGYLATEGDASDFALALRRFFDAPETLASFGTRARELVSRNHTLERGQTSLQNVLDAVATTLHMGREPADGDATTGNSSKRDGSPH